MANPWLKKNPFMSMWLSSANAATHTARGKMAAQAKRQTQAAVGQTSQDMVSLWTAALTGTTPVKKRRRR